MATDITFKKEHNNNKAKIMFNIKNEVLKMNSGNFLFQLKLENIRFVYTNLNNNI